METRKDIRSYSGRSSSLIWPNLQNDANVSWFFFKFSAFNEPILDHDSDATILLKIFIVMTFV